MNCIYCHRPIITDEPGYGYMTDEVCGTEYYHAECINVFEEVAIA